MRRSTKSRSSRRTHEGGGPRPTSSAGKGAGRDHRDSTNWPHPVSSCVLRVLHGFVLHPLQRKHVPPAHPHPSLSSPHHVVPVAGLQLPADLRAAADQAEHLLCL